MIRPGVFPRTLTRAAAAWAVWRRAISALLVVISLVFVLALLYHNAADIRLSLVTLTVHAWFQGLMCAAAMLLAKCLYHSRIVVSLGYSDAGRMPFIAGYAVSQIVRYTPGKIWGIVYQSAHSGPAIPPASIAVGNLLQFVYTNLLTAGLIVAAGLLYIDAHWLAAATAMASLALLHVLHSGHQGMTLLVQRMSSARGNTRDSTRDSSLSDSPDSSSNAGKARPVLHGTVLLMIDWLFFILLWQAILPADTSLTALLFIVALYSSAAIIAIVAAVSPGGLGVREALFIALGSQLGVDAAILISSGILARLLLTIAELGLALTLSLLARQCHEQD